LHRRRSAFEQHPQVRGWRRIGAARAQAALGHLAHVRFPARDRSGPARQPIEQCGVGWGDSGDINMYIRDYIKEIKIILKK